MAYRFSHDLAPRQLNGRNQSTGVCVVVIKANDVVFGATHTTMNNCNNSIFIEHPVVFDLFYQQRVDKRVITGGLFAPNNLNIGFQFEDIECISHLVA
jgi:hypothetical protein